MLKNLGNNHTKECLAPSLACLVCQHTCIWILFIGEEF